MKGQLHKATTRPNKNKKQETNKHPKKPNKHRTTPPNKKPKVAARPWELYPATSQYITPRIGRRRTHQVNHRHSHHLARTDTQARAQEAHARQTETTSKISASFWPYRWTNLCVSPFFWDDAREVPQRSPRSISAWNIAKVADKHPKKRKQAPNHPSKTFFFYSLCCGQGTCSLLQRYRWNRMLSRDIEMSGWSETAIQSGVKSDKDGELKQYRQRARKTPKRSPKSKQPSTTTDSLRSLSTSRTRWWTRSAESSTLQPQTQKVRTKSRRRRELLQGKWCCLKA